MEASYTISRYKKIYKCPFCKKYFEPQRSNQLYCNNRHAFTFRNHLNKLKNIELANLLKRQLANLKLLTTLEVLEMDKFTNEELNSLGFDWQGVSKINNPLNSKSLAQWVEVFGFIIRITPKPESNKHWILSPLGVKKLLP